MRTRSIFGYCWIAHKSVKPAPILCYAALTFTRKPVRLALKSVNAAPKAVSRWAMMHGCKPALKLAAVVQSLVSKWRKRDKQFMCLAVNPARAE
jgi:hypothetical protein